MLPCIAALSLSNCNLGDTLPEACINSILALKSINKFVNIHDWSRHSHLIFTDIIPYRTKKFSVFPHGVNISLGSPKFLQKYPKSLQPCIPYQILRGPYIFQPLLLQKFFCGRLPTRDPWQKNILLRCDAGVPFKAIFSRACHWRTKSSQLIASKGYSSTRKP